MLTHNHRAQFERDGFTIVASLMGPDVLEAVRADYARVMDTLYRRWHARGLVAPAPDALDLFGQIEAATRAGLDWFQPLDISLPGGRIAPDTPFHVSQPVLDMLTAPELLDAVEGLLGPELTSVPIQHVRIKPPAGALRGGESLAHVTPTAWHQDRGVGHADADATQMVTCWIAMTDADETNACLTAVPGAHRSGMVVHCPQVQTSIAPGLVDEARAVPLRARAGDVVLLHPLTPHASLPNGATRFRWSFDVRYAVTGQPTGRAHFPAFVARSRADPTRELRDGQRWRAMWEAARAACAAAPHIPIHRWDAAAPACA